MTLSKVGLLVMAYGSPDSPGQVEAYYTHIRGGRRPAPEQLEELQARYRAIGGSSPLARITHAQTAALVQQLKGREPGLQFMPYIGCKHAAPFIEDAVESMRREGVSRAVSLVLTPHYSALSVGDYNARAAAAATRLGGPQLVAARAWYRQPRFVEYWATQIRSLLARSAASGHAPAAVIFSAHSLPTHINASGDPYVAQVEESAQLIARAAQLADFALAWQSAGRSAERWIGPDILETTRRLHAEHPYRSFIYCPIGFVADHLEVLYDNDIECRRVVEELGAGYLRPPMPNTDPGFIGALADEVAARIAELDGVAA